MVDSRQYWMDQVLRQVAEENMNPEVLSRDYGDPRFSRRPMQPESKPYFGGAQPAVDFALSLLPQQQPSGVMVENPRTGLVEELMINPMVAEPNSFKGMGRGKKVPKKKLTPEEIRARKDKETIKKEQEAVRSNKLFSDSLNHDLEIRELSRTQYDELINDGWKHQDIMNEHPVIPASVRREGRKWLELDSPPTPKTARTDLTEEGFDNFYYNDYRAKFATGDLDNLGPMEKVVKDFSERDPELWRSFVRDVAEMDPDDPFVITDFVENYMNTVTGGTHGITGISVLPSHNFIDTYRRTAAELPELFRVDPETLHIIYSPDPNWVRSIDAGLPVQKGYFQPPTS